MNIKTKALVFLSAVLFSWSAVAGGGSMRFDNGKVLVKPGSPSHTILRYLGKPLQTSRSVVCFDGTSSVCKEWRVVETWFYFHDELNWQISVSNGRVLNIDWSRF